MKKQEKARSCRIFTITAETSRTPSDKTQHRIRIGILGWYLPRCIEYIKHDVKIARCDPALIFQRAGGEGHFNPACAVVRFQRRNPLWGL